jgi:hypothetical protein
MIENILKNRKHVREYDSNANIPKSLIDLLLQKTWAITPSKNNFMPYTVHVLGPEHQMYKEMVYLLAVSNENYMNSFNPIRDIDNVNPNYKNILSCSYLLIFTMRLETQPNLFQQQQIQKGIYYEATDFKKLNDMSDTASLEVGLFANTFSGLCLENDIDTSYTLCFRRNLEYWKELPFVKRLPLLIITVGKAKTYRQDIAKKEGWAQNDLKPSYERIVNFVN